MAYDYDDENIFAKILRGEIPNQTVAESEHTLAFKDIMPKAPHHVLVIPKGKYVTADDFSANASEAEIVDFWRLVAQITAQLSIAPDGGAGYRMISNAGGDGVQEVPHFHLHILGGRNMGPMVA